MIASLPPGSGTAGRSFGHTSAVTPSATTTARSATSTSRNGLTFRRTRGRGSTETTRIRAPTGSVAPPVIATTPLFPNQTPGVAKPCSASSALITANAVPTSIVRVSPRRAPTIVRPTAAPAATAALKPTDTKCVCPVYDTVCPPSASSTTAGIAATTAPSASSTEKRRISTSSAGSGHFISPATLPRRAEGPQRRPQERRDRRPCRPREDDSGRRDALALRLHPGEPGPRRTGDGLDGSRAREGHHDPRQEHGGAARRQEDQHR